MNEFLPVTKEDLDARGWHYVDFLVVTGDAYVDHPSFGHAIIARVLEDAGFRVGVIAQPRVDGLDDITRLGRPRYGVMVSGGVIDSMVNHYTASKKRRSKDVYSPGGKAGLRPDRCVTAYCGLVRRAFGDIPIIIGGVEASLRRFAHYDYWADRVMPSILMDSGADLLSYGMGEHQTAAIAKALKKREPLPALCGLAGVCYLADAPPEGAVLLPSFEEVSSDKKKYALAAKIEYEEQDAVRGKTLCQKHGRRFLVQTPPSAPLSRQELDKVYALPYTRRPHPMYAAAGGVPAIEEVQFSITSSRGCFGACTFCALTMHQGRVVQSRSEESILQEAGRLTRDADFKGYINDVGGPTANFSRPACDKQLKKGTCKDKMCLYPKVCPAAKVTHTEYLNLLRKLRALPGVKKVFIRSGIRYDYLIADKDDTFFRELLAHHVSGQLKVAPEHVSDNVLKYMGKPPLSVYQRFSDKFYRLCKEAGKEQYLVPYLMSSHQGSSLSDAIALAVYLKQHRIFPEQVQDFYPTPGTLATAMFYTGLDPRDMRPVYVAKDPREKAMQRALLQFANPKNYDLVYEALIKAGRKDLIGFTKECLIRPRNTERKKQEKDDFRRKWKAFKRRA